jgi:hypothetical protein
MAFVSAMMMNRRTLPERKARNLVGFEVLTALSMKIAVFWVVAACSLLEVYQRFRGHHDDGGSKDL